MAWLDDLTGKRITQNGVALPDRKTLNFLVSSSLSVVDNPANGSTDVVLTDVGAYSEVTAHAGGGQAGAVVVSERRTLVSASGVSGTDSIRFFDANDGIPFVAGMDGEISNESGHAVALFPAPTRHIYSSGVDQGADASISVGNGARVLWFIDNAGHYRCKVIA